MSGRTQITSLTRVELNCTLASISDPFFHLLEFYIHSDAPLSCRLPSRPPYHLTTTAKPPPKREYIPLVFALAGTLQLSHLHISTHLNILLHSVPKHHLHPHDSGVLDSGAAYSTSPLSHITGPKALTKKLTIGESLPLLMSVRWFPSSELPRENGRVEWNGLGGHVHWGMLGGLISGFGAGAVVAGAWCLGVELPRRLRGRGLGGATPLGGGGRVGNGWGMGGKRD